jgi:Fe-S cluster biogenesis protein NfuA
LKEPPSVEKPALGVPDTSAYDRPKVRKVVEAPRLVDDGAQTAWSEEVRIKARVDGDGTSCVFMVDRPVLDGYSAWLPGSQWAEDVSPLAAELFKVKGVGSVLLHNMTVTAGLAHGVARPWEDMAAEVAAVIRDYLKAGKPVVTKAFMASMPPEEEVQKRLQSCVDLEINPGIASHSGVITLERVEGNTIWITMGGGCQGCAASTITLRQGIHTSFRQAVPQIGAIYDATDHAAGENPFYSELPAGMA